MTQLTCEKEGIRLDLIPYSFDIDATRLHVFDGEEKAAMTAYLEKISAPIADGVELQNYFYGWTLLGKCYWCPVPPASLESADLADYRAAGKLNNLRCEAHASLSRNFFRMIFEEKIELARAYSAKIKELQKMPV